MEIAPTTLEQRVTQGYECLAGLQIPLLPIARATATLTFPTVISRYTAWLQALHQAEPSSQVRLALLLTNQPSGFLGATVQVSLICVATASEAVKARSSVTRVLSVAQSLLPNDSNFDYGHVRRLRGEELAALLFPPEYENANFEAYELRKPLESHLDPGCTGLDARYVTQAQEVTSFGHPWWVDPQRDIVHELIELLSRQHTYCALIIQFQPHKLAGAQVSELAHVLQAYQEAISEWPERYRLANQRFMIADKSDESLIEQSKNFRAMGLNDQAVGVARRGAVALQALYAGQHRLFASAIRVLGMPHTAHMLVNQVAALVASPQASQAEARLGWRALECSRQREINLDEARWLMLSLGAWNTSLPYLVTAEELAQIVHLPVLPANTQTNAVETSNVPFLIPPTLRPQRRSSQEPEDPKLKLGFLFDRAKEMRGGEQEMSFCLPRKLFVQPSILVGAPGSGKTNLALYLLQQWHEQGCPFLVIDPSTGQEFRYLLADAKLKEQLVVFSLGDDDFVPLRFNPLVVPPKVPLRSHINRLIGCFKAAYEMWDPLPTIYEQALFLAYRQTGWQPHEKGGAHQRHPTLSDLAQAMNTILEGEMSTQFAGDAEGIGRIRGSSQIRLNGLRDGIGHLLDVEQNDTEFFAKVLKGPTVIELGALGDQNVITLMMAFLLTQLVGWIEHLRPPQTYTGPEHLLMIEEAHRLLAAEGGAKEGSRGKTAEEIGVMLAEMRKFRQGVMVLDQRPSSLIGSVLDNARINLMGRLNDAEGFQRLSYVLNLNEEQQRFARTRLQAGQTLTVDTASGLPVLFRPPSVRDELLDTINNDPSINLRERSQANANTRELHVPPRSTASPAKPQRQANANTRELHVPPAPSVKVEDERFPDWLTDEARSELIKRLKTEGENAASSHLFNLINKLKVPADDPYTKRKDQRELLARLKEMA